MDDETVRNLNDPAEETLIGPGDDAYADESSEADEETPAKSRSGIVALSMFAATVLSTFWVGMVAGAGAISPKFFFQLPVEAQLVLAQNGLIYSGALLLILGFHEMGHYLQAWRYGVRASFPFFIPMPISPFGTMGAVIIQGEHAGNRKTLFDIAISGPLAGLVVALPVLYWGLSQTTSASAPAQSQRHHLRRPHYFALDV